MKIKVCGMKYPDNINDLLRLPIDLIGLIFYEKSPRYAGSLNAGELGIVPSNVQKVGVFVDENEENIWKKKEQYGLQMLQLHGSESPDLCKRLKDKGIKIIKAFQIEKGKDLEKTACYETVCDYFLFDARTPLYGGSGKKFDWRILSSYSSKKPFFLSGGIDKNDFEIIRQCNIPQLYAVDLNSRFEISPGLKDISRIQDFLLPFIQANKLPVGEVPLENEKWKKNRS
ncbi:MAG: phosphoribosylanthranilate isomerase [Candidatus Azobacteroides sp.]|nr:phosphoribosylanthranilate isomerase [Candidatus Azobacteroides sp.]